MSKLSSMTTRAMTMTKIMMGATAILGATDCGAVLATLAVSAMTEERGQQLRTEETLMAKTTVVASLIRMKIRHFSSLTRLDLRVADYGDAYRLRHFR
jgi:hypothetical protein